MERKNLCLGSDYARLELGPGLGEVRRDVNSRSGPANKANEQGQLEGSLRQLLISHRFSGLVLGDAPVGSYILRGLEKEVTIFPWQRRASMQQISLIATILV